MGKNKHVLDFWGIESSEPDTTVKVWVDESLKESPKDEQTQHVEDETGTSVGNKVRNMGMNAQLNKEERIFKLVHAFKRGEVETLQDAMVVINMGKSTVLKYLRELDWRLFCMESKKYVGGTQDTPQDLLKFSDGRIKYYTKDPSEGGTELSQLEYEERFK